MLKNLDKFFVVWPFLMSNSLHIKLILNIEVVLGADKQYLTIINKSNVGKKS